LDRESSKLHEYGGPVAVLPEKKNKWIHSSKLDEK
jgi:hypothetical protein